MEIISIDKNLFDSLAVSLENIATLTESLYTPNDYSSQKWLDNQEVCSILKISKRTLQHFRDNGSLPYSQIGYKIFYKPKDIENFLKVLSSKNEI